MKVQSVWVALTLTAACGPRPLTRDEAADLISKSLALRASEQLQLATPSGCFLLAGRTEVSGSDVERDPQLAASPYLLSTVRRERELGLIEFEFSEMPADSSVPPVECGRVRTALRAGEASGPAGAQSRFVAWKTMPSDKAMAAGLQSGQTFLYLRQTLIDITQLNRKDDGTMVAEYRWHWAPSYEGEHLGIQASEPMIGKTRFKNAGGGWRVVR
jgi:hypothetical protein